MVRAKALAGFTETANSLGADATALLRRSGLEPSALSHPDEWLPFGSLLQAYSHAAAVTGRADFGMKLAEQRDLSYLGALLVVFKNSATVGEGLKDCARYLRVQNTGFKVRVQTAGARASVVIQMNDKFRAGADQWVEESILTIIKLLRVVLGESFDPDSVRLRHVRLSTDAVYRSYLGVRPVFRAATDELVLDSALLRQQNPQGDADTARFLRDYLEQRVPAGDNEVADTILSLLRDMLPTGEFSIDVVAAQLGIHRRTLQRRLAAEGKSYADILEECRATIAADYLRDHSLPIVNLSNLLGYADQSAFNHAFRRWYGLSPSEWRSRLSPKNKNPVADSL